MLLIEPKRGLQATPGHAEPQGEALGVRRQREQERNMGKSLYDGFCGKEPVRWDEQALGWLIEVILVGSGVWGPSLVVCYLALGRLWQGNSSGECESR